MGSKKPILWPKAGPRLQRIGTCLSLLGFGSCKILGRDYPMLVLWGTLFVVIGGALVVMGNMFSPQAADAKVKDDPRAPILFLRPFVSDKPRFWYRLYCQIFGYGGYGQNVYTPEEVISDIFSNFGPFIALGKPGERVVTPGAARLYVDDDEWKTTLEGWLQRAGLVVFHIGDGESLWWEFERIVQECRPRKLLIYVPSVKEEKRREEVYKSFRLRASSILPHALPGFIGSSIFIWFDDDWQPILLSFSKLTVRQYLPVAFKTRQYKIFIEILLSLRPVLAVLSDAKIEMRGIDLEKLAADLKVRSVTKAA